MLVTLAPLLFAVHTFPLPSYVMSFGAAPVPKFFIVHVVVHDAILILVTVLEAKFAVHILVPSKTIALG